MAIQTVKTGEAVNDGTGDDARTCFTKINQNFTTNSHAASRLVGTAKGNVMEVGAYGLGGSVSHNTDSLLHLAGFQGISASATGVGSPLQCVTVGWTGGVSVIGVSATSNRMFFGTFTPNNPLTLNTGWAEVRSSANTTKDPNGFIKVASPIVSIYSDKIELNDEAAQQKITFVKNGVGDYLVKGSTGFAQDGWYIEMPKDANGNALIAVIYEQLENKDISVKTYDYMLNKKGRIVPDLETPLDIPETRWIDIRLQELPQTDVNPADETVAADAE